MDALLRWSSGIIKGNQERHWLGALAEVLTIWLRVADSHTRHLLLKSFFSLEEDDLIAWLQYIEFYVGGAAAQAIHKLFLLMVGPISLSQLPAALSELLESEGAGELRSPSLTPEGTVIGRAIIQSMMGERQQLDIKWVINQRHKGISALPLIAGKLKQVERVSFVSLMLDALAHLHTEHLEPTQGFAPERLIINHRFEMILKPSLPTQLIKLQSPERHKKRGGSKTADVWTFARLSIPLLSNTALNTSIEQAILKLPEDLHPSLKRSLHPKPDQRFFSARELKAVIAPSLKSWTQKLVFEEGSKSLDQTEGLSFEDHQLKKEQEQEERVAKRRAQEQALIKRQSNKRKRGLSVAILIFALAIYGMYYGVITLQEYIDQKHQNNVALAYAKAERLALEDQKYQKLVPAKLIQEGFKWRSLTPQPSKAVHLMSESEVTQAQYHACVVAGECPTGTQGDQCTLEPTPHSSTPITCISFDEAAHFAKYVGGRLPTVEEWQEALTTSAMLYPWGNQKPTLDQANLFFVNEGQTLGLKEVCQYRLGDTERSLCDMIGNVTEWVETQSGAGIIGEAWYRRPDEVNLTPYIIPKTTKSSYLGFRVIKTLPTDWSLESSEEAAPSVVNDQAGQHATEGVDE